MAIQAMEEVRPEIQHHIDEIRRIAKEKWLPYVREFEALGGAQARLRMAGPWMDMWTALRDARLLAISAPKEYGGLGVDTLTDLGILIYEASKSGQSVSYAAFMCQSEAVVRCLKWASEKTREKYLRRTVAGGIAAFFLTEPHTGVDYGAIQATAVRKGDSYVINGPKWWVGHSDPGPFGLNFSVVLAKTDPSKRLEGLSMFVVDNDNPGVVLGREGDMVGFRVYPRWEVSLKDCVVPKENLIGQEGHGGRILIDAINRSYGFTAYNAVGLGEACLSYTLDYTKKRVVFGHPIADYQGIHFNLADMAVSLEASRALAHKACQMWDMGLPDAVKFVVMAKLQAALCVERITTDCMKIFAAQAVERGLGHPIERMWRETFIFNLQRTPNLDKRFIASAYLGRRLRAGFEY